MHISQLAERTGVPASTLRYYESVGLLPADRDSAGYRVYDESAVRRLEFIGAAKRFGLPLTEIRDLLETWSTDHILDARLRHRLAAYLREAERRFAELATFMASLRITLARLEAVPGELSRRSGNITDETI